jgi:rRNA-processing protein FCF1
MSKLVKQRFYIDFEYDVKAIPKKEVQACIKQALQNELVDLARDFQTSIKSSTVTVSSEPRQVRKSRQASKDYEVQYKQRWTY